MGVLTSIVTYLRDIALGLALLLCATVVFDVIHVLLHRLARRPQAVLARIGALHTVHHEFLDSDLRIHDDKLLANVFHHVIPEFIVQLLVTAMLAPFFPMIAVATALVIECGVFLFIMWGKPGIDVNHKPIEQLKAYQPLYFCVPEYHLLHHVYPDAHFSSWIKTLDHVLSTGLSLKQRRILMTDNHTPLNAALAQALEGAGCVVRGVDATSVVDPLIYTVQLRQAGILLLCHDGTGVDYLRWLQQFHQQHRGDRIPVEVWEVYDDVSHKSEARTRAREQFHAQQVIYRQLWTNPQRSVEANVSVLLKKLRRGDNLIRVRSWF